MSSTSSSTSAYSFDCGICLSPIKNPVTLACGSHSFCLPCARQWLSKQSTATPLCPCCRVPVSNKIPHVNVVLRDALECIALLSNGNVFPKRVPKPRGVYAPLLDKSADALLPKSPFPIFDQVSISASNGLYNSIANYHVASNATAVSGQFGVQLPAAAPAVEGSTVLPKFGSFGSTPGSFLSVNSAFKFQVPAAAVIPSPQPAALPA